MIYGNYKIWISHKICSDSYPIPNIETAIYKLLGINFFAKINLKTVYNQIQIDENIKEDIMIAKGLLRWKRMPYSVKKQVLFFKELLEMC